MLKKTVFYILGPCVLIFTVALSYLWLSIPRADIERLEKGYVKIDIVDHRPSYKIVSERPEFWVDLDSLDPKIYMAIVLSEDWGFFEHSGVDWGQMKEALSDYLMKGARLRGASTISQQLVKNLFLTHDRSFKRKLQELFITMEIEKRLSKEKILELYLNIVQFGEGIYGIKASAQTYFALTPQKLNSKEAAFLAMLLPNPIRYAQSYHDKELTAYGRQTVESILSKMRMYGTLTSSEFEEQKSEALRFDGVTSTPMIQEGPLPEWKGEAALFDDEIDFDFSLPNDLDTEFSPE